MPCNCNSIEKKSSERLCTVCDFPLFGRSDKVFCSLRCKNKYHSSIRKSTKSVTNETIKVLYRNHQILTELMGENCSKYEISKLVLQRKGFDFDVISGIEQNKFGYKLNVFDFSWYLVSARKVQRHNKFGDFENFMSLKMLIKNRFL